MDRRRHIFGFFSRPAFGLAGWLLALIAFLATAHFYRATREGPLLTYSTRPLRTIVVRRGHPSDLQVFYDGKEIKSPVTGVEVVIWNRGDEVIHDTNILEPVFLHMSKRTPILDVRAKAGRSAMGFEANTEKAETGEVALAWKVLAPGDAASVRIIYAGDPEIDITMGGMIEGQDRIRRFYPPEGTIVSRAFDPTMRKAVEIYVGFIVFMVLAAGAMLVYAGSLLPPGLRWLRWIAALALVAFTAFICHGMWGTFETPPVGF
jgi:hypothetical protein